MPETTTGQPAAGDPPKDPATPTTPSTPTAPPATGQPDDKKDEPLGEKGLKALQAERAAREELEKQVKALEPLQQLAPLQKLVEVLGGGDADKGKTEAEQLAERFAALQKDVTDERSARWRAEVAHEKGLTPEQAARLQGATRDELAADADALKALFPTAEPAAPRWGPSDGGARGTQPQDLTQQIQTAESKGDWRTARALKAQQLAAAKPNSN